MSGHDPAEVALWRNTPVGPVARKRERPELENELDGLRRGLRRDYPEVWAWLVREVEATSSDPHTLALQAGRREVALRLVGSRTEEKRNG